MTSCQKLLLVIGNLVWKKIRINPMQCRTTHCKCWFRKNERVLTLWSAMTLWRTLKHQRDFSYLTSPLPSPNSISSPPLPPRWVSFLTIPPLYQNCISSQVTWLWSGQIDYSPNEVVGNWFYLGTRAIRSLTKIPILLAIGGGLRNTFSKLKLCMKSNFHDGKTLRNCPI